MMKGMETMYIFLHGLGQTPSSWNGVIRFLPHGDIYVPSLWDMAEGSVTFGNLYNSFKKQCGEYGELNICGISLGAVLGLMYAVENPQRVKSLILIAPMYKMPKGLLTLQNMIFHAVPEKAFEKMMGKNGLSKNEAIGLMESMKDINLSSGLKNIDCPILIVCGKRDRANMKHSIKLFKAVKNARLAVIKNSGHEVNIQGYKELAEVIDKFWFNGAGRKKNNTKKNNIKKERIKKEA